MNPFAALGLPARPDLTDEQVRAAWRAIAAATHPDRDDGGNPAAYAAASAAYTVLRTPWGRSEAYADLTAHAPPPALPVARTARSDGAARLLRGVAPVPARVRHGRLVRLVPRVLAVGLLTLVVLRSGAGAPAIGGVVAGLVVWFARTVRADLAPPPGR